MWSTSCNTGHAKLDTLCSYINCLVFSVGPQIVFILLAMCLGEENSSVLCVDVDPCGLGVDDDPCGLKWMLSYNICV